MATNETGDLRTGRPPGLIATNSDSWVAIGRKFRKKKTNDGLCASLRSSTFFFLLELPSLEVGPQARRWLPSVTKRRRKKVTDNQRHLQPPPTQGRGPCAKTCSTYLSMSRDSCWKDTWVKVLALEVHRPSGSMVGW